MSAFLEGGGGGADWLLEPGLLRPLGTFWLSARGPKRPGRRTHTHPVTHSPGAPRGGGAAPGIMDFHAALLKAKL